MTGFIYFRSICPWTHTLPAGSNQTCFFWLWKKYISQHHYLSFQYLHAHLTPTILLSCVKYPYNLETLALVSYLSLLESFPKQTIKSKLNLSKLLQSSEINIVKALTIDCPCLLLIKWTGADLWSSKIFTSQLVSFFKWMKERSYQSPDVTQIWNQTRTKTAWKEIFLHLQCFRTPVILNNYI